jgi:hypothetical protein
MSIGELSLKIQFQIFELGKFEHPGSREDDLLRCYVTANPRLKHQDFLLLPKEQFQVL